MKYLTAAIVSAGALLVGCGTDSQNRLGLASPGKLAGACADLATKFNFANTTVASATDVTAGTLTLAGASVAAHCLVKGGMYNRTTADSKAWAIGFEMRLPVEWNGRYFYQANGGVRW